MDDPTKQDAATPETRSRLGRAIVIAVVCVAAGYILYVLLLFLGLTIRDLWELRKYGTS